MNFCEYIDIIYLFWAKKHPKMSKFVEKYAIIFERNMKLWEVLIWMIRLEKN